LTLIDVTYYVLINENRYRKNQMKTSIQSDLPQRSAIETRAILKLAQIHNETTGAGAMPNTVGPAAAEGVPQQYALTAAILRYRGEWNLYLAECTEAEGRGEDDGRVAPIYKKSSRVIETWDQPAEAVNEAILALETALDDYDVGDTDRIPAMMRAALGWMIAHRKQAAEGGQEAVISSPVRQSISKFIDAQDRVGEAIDFTRLVSSAIDSLESDDDMKAISAGVYEVEKRLSLAKALLEEQKKAALR
jgi:hypothetical protein